MAFSVPDSTWILEQGEGGLNVARRYANPICGVDYGNLRAVGDADADGRMEMAFAYGGGPFDIVFMESQIPEAYPDSESFRLEQPDIGPSYMCAADMDRDGRGEYIASKQGSSPCTVVIWESCGEDLFDKTYGAWMGVTGQLSVGDFDDDGRGDLVIPSNYYAPDVRRVSVLECDRNDSYRLAWSRDLATENFYWTCAGPDIDADGRGDFFTLGGSGGPEAVWLVTMFESTGNDNYEAVWSYQLVSGWINGGITTGDLDGDGVNELMVQVPDRTVIFRASGDNELQPSWSHVGSVIGQGHHRIFGTDFDRDGRGEAVWWTRADPYAVVVYERTNGLSDVREFSADWPELQVYPNPVREQALMSWPSESGEGWKCDIVDCTGRRIAGLRPRFAGGRATAEWRTERQAAGMYFCRLQSGPIVVTRRLLVMH